MGIFNSDLETLNNDFITLKEQNDNLKNELALAKSKKETVPRAILK